MLSSSAVCGKARRLVFKKVTRHQFLIVIDAHWPRSARRQASKTIANWGLKSFFDNGHIRHLVFKKATRPQFLILTGAHLGPGVLDVKLFAIANWGLVTFFNTERRAPWPRCARRRPPRAASAAGARGPGRWPPSC